MPIAIQALSARAFTHFSRWDGASNRLPLGEKTSSDEVASTRGKKKANHTGLLFLHKRQKKFFLAVKSFDVDDVIRWRYLKILLIRFWSAPSIVPRTVFWAKSENHVFCCAKPISLLSEYLSYYWVNFSWPTNLCGASKKSAHTCLKNQCALLKQNKSFL